MRRYFYNDRIADDFILLNVGDEELAAIDSVLRAITAGDMEGHPVTMTLLDDMQLMQIRVGRLWLNYSVDDSVVRLVSVIE